MKTASDNVERFAGGMGGGMKRKTLAWFIHTYFCIQQKRHTGLGVTLSEKKVIPEHHTGLDPTVSSVPPYSSTAKCLLLIQDVLGSKQEHPAPVESVLHWGNWQALIGQRSKIQPQVYLNGYRTIGSKFSRRSQVERHQYCTLY